MTEENCATSSSGETVDRTYLFVPPEEKAEVEALGGRWDSKTMCWYIGSDEEPARFSRWLSDSDESDEGFGIVSSQAYVASARASCASCGSTIEVICIYCENGMVSGDPLYRFTLCDVWAMDEALVRQLDPWPQYKKVRDPASQEEYFANHCPGCGTMQDDLYLHSEPGDPFFSIEHAAQGSIELTALVGEVRLSGSEHFEIG
jgi:hypothetical protein